jgi:hypothetical protein
MKKTYCAQCKKKLKTVVDGSYYWAGHPVCKEHFDKSLAEARMGPRTHR